MSYPYGATEAAAELGCSVTTLYRRWANGTGPRSHKLGKLRIVYADDLAIFKAGLPRS